MVCCILRYMVCRCQRVLLGSALRYEVERDGVRVSNLFPGFVKTNINAHARPLCKSKDDHSNEGIDDSRFCHLALGAVCGGLANSWIAEQPLLSACYLINLPLIGEPLRKLLSRKCLRDDGYSDS